MQVNKASVCQSVSSEDPVDLADIMETIKSMNGSMNEKCYSLESTLSQMLAKLTEVTSRVTELKNTFCVFINIIFLQESHIKHGEQYHMKCN